MDVLDAIWTTRAMRRLDATRPVADSDLLLILEAAGKAPSGGNRQLLRWLVIRDPTLRHRVGEIYRAAARPAILADYAEAATQDPAVARMLASALHLADHLGEAPVLLVPCAPSDYVRVEASVYPAVQNLMLAARSLGLGTTLTQAHRRGEAPLRELLGIPEDVTTFAIIPVGHPLGRWAEAARRPVREIAYWDRWGETDEELPERIRTPDP